MTANGHAVVITTTNTSDHAGRLARKLVENELAACVQVFPIQSYYRWKGEVAVEGEFLLLIKSRPALLPRLERLIEEDHPYETPEVVQLPITGGSADYLDWIDEATA